MIVVDHPDHGRYELPEDVSMALKALAIGYPQIDRRHGVLLLFLGLARKTSNGFLITREGMKAIAFERYEVPSHTNETLRVANKEATKEKAK